MNQFRFPVSFGTVIISWNSSEQLSRIEWSYNRLTNWQRVKVPNHLAELIDQLRDYFYKGEPLGPIAWDILDQSEWSPFQKAVFQTIIEIPHGETRTYKWVATRLGNPRACRAVGRALRSNPFPILIPCHRVFSMSSVGGFMGVADPNEPEVQLKQRLIQLEESYRSPVFSFLSAGAHWKCLSRPNASLRQFA